VSRGRDDDPEDLGDRAPEQVPDQRHDPRPHERSDEIAARGLTLPRGEERELVEFRGREYTLNGSETRALATVGAFRVVSPADFGPDHGRDARHGDWRHLADQGLLTRETLTDQQGSREVVALTREGKDLLDAHATPGRDGQRQEYYAEVVKPRELRHDSQLYRVFQAEAARIEDEGGRITRVVLDYELKRDYQQFLNRRDRESDGEGDDDLMRDRMAFAEANDLTIVRGHLELPDLRIEYETEDGRLEHRDVELVTEHYPRSQLAGKWDPGVVPGRSTSSV
jgi:hypothetical protein